MYRPPEDPLKCKNEAEFGGTAPTTGSSVVLGNPRPGKHEESKAVPPSAPRFASLDSLRGLAALSVCWFHFTYCERAWLGADPFTLLGKYGELGVPVFFVISGFIIPYSLARANYSPLDFGRFLVKRLVRLDPPYLAAIGFTVAIGLALHLLTGSKNFPHPIDSAAQLFSHLGYANAVLGYRWINPVFWTLALEFQYYLLIGLAFPLFVSRNAALRTGTLAMMLLLSWAEDRNLIFPWLPLFVFGILTFHHTSGRLGRAGFLAGTVLVALLLYSKSHDPLHAGIPLLTAWCLAFTDYSNPTLRFLGDISYSLYLIHYPLGKLLLGFAKSVDLGLGAKYIAIFATTAISVAVAALWFVCLEKPARELAARIRYSAKAQ